MENRTSSRKTRVGLVVSDKMDKTVVVAIADRVMFEIAGVSEEVAREALRLASHKLPVKCKIIKREEVVEGGEA